MINVYASFLFSICLPFVLMGQPCFTCDNAPEGTIFCDDFESGEPLEDRYFEYGAGDGKFVPLDGVGRDSSVGMRAQWDAGQVGVGGFKKSFGRTPSDYIGNHAVYPNVDFDEIYWRLDLRTQAGWQGGGAAKLSRAMTLARSNWSQGMIAHIWSGGPNDAYLGMDPASGVSESGTLVSTKYNDFNNLRWLGWKSGNIDLFTTQNSNKWYCVEAHVKLNTPGENDGIFEFWINDTLQAGTYDLNWHGTWNSDPNNPKINAIFVENYWNSGSPVQQERYMDNFVISTNKIGCECEVITSSKTESISQEVTISPNPSNGLVRFKTNRELAMHGYQIELYNSMGALVFQSATVKDLSISLDFSFNDSGLYFYRVLSNSRNIKDGILSIIRE